VDSLVPNDIDSDEEWSEQVDQMVAFAADGDADAVWGWFADHYPRCMALVPARRRDQFVKGVIDGLEDDGRI
jgi:hypothetical protein